MQNKIGLQNILNWITDGLERFMYDFYGHPLRRKAIGDSSK